ncbi:MAG: tRNA-dihydrouridine synthase family protein [Elusimicrobia bacterium]|nr:tRNA-dihydrouridine synthase family protein [Elusimicrobiota bacterium]
MGPRIGALRLDAPVLQSPMADCSDLPMRLVSRRRGLRFAFAEMVSAPSLVRRGAKTLDLLKTVPEDRPLGAQLLGRDPARMAAAAAVIEGLGFDWLDLNFGCPVRKVVSNGEGAALLREPGLAEDIFEAVRRAVKLPLTVKTRAGFSDPSGREAAELARRAQAQGLDAIIVHGRTQAQGYGGVSSPEAAALVRRAVSIPVIANGDVRSGGDALRLREATGCAAVMIGRAGLGNPWLYAEVERAWAGQAPAAPAGRTQRRDALLEHFELELRHLGERKALLNMRRIGGWYTAGLPGAKALRVALCAAMDAAALRGAIEEYFDGRSSTGIS